MKHLAAYLLLGLGGNTSPSAADVKAVLESVGIEADSDRLDKLISELEGKDINELIASGSEKLASSLSPATSTIANMADADYDPEAAAALKAKRAFRKFSYRGVDLEQLLDLGSEELRDLVHARARRRFNRGLKRKPMGLIKKLRKSKQEARPNEKPDLVKTHLRDMIVVPEMIGSVIGVYSGKEFNQVEIKPEMVGHYLAEFSISYRPVKHGRPGIGATHSSRFIPLK
ncbi:RpsS, Ribosomal protein S19 [Pyrenophora tritici-repentis]|nr:RpsS, Ribosomal protein S19 [Pyrenophora tritici-repentis]